MSVTVNTATQHLNLVCPADKNYFTPNGPQVFNKNVSKLDNPEFGKPSQNRVSVGRLSQTSDLQHTVSRDDLFIILTQSVSDGNFHQW